MISDDDLDPARVFARRDPASGPASHRIGQDLAQLSVDEIEERIAVLGEEIIRLKQAAAAKTASLSAAAALFKSS